MPQVVEQYYPKSKQHWRTWLEKKHVRKNAVWIIFYKKKVNKPTITWSEAVVEALCFGWIDSIKRTLDDERSIQFFSKRKPNSTWSKINKEKVKQLIESKKMTPAGMACIETAKQNGSWNVLDEVEMLVIPNDLEKAFKLRKGTKKYFLTLNKSAIKLMLQSIALARKPETRQRRIEKIIQVIEEQKNKNDLNDSKT